MDISVWVIATLFIKLLLYISYACSLGGIAAASFIHDFEPRRFSFFNYTLFGIGVGLCAATADFFVQVGSFADSGLAGMLDTVYIDILWQSGAGTSYVLRLIGWGSLLVLLCMMWFSIKLVKPLSQLCFVISLFIAVSFTTTGHTSEQFLWVKAALIIHITVAMWWFGFLYPLRQWCKAYPTNTVQKIMHAFGQQAARLVLLLLLAGLVLAYVLEGSLEGLFNSNHGRLLLLKVVTVAGILGLAAIHKLYLVPSLVTAKATQILRLSISVEMGIGLSILLITAVLSTLVGPPLLQH